MNDPPNQKHWYIALLGKWFMFIDKHLIKRIQLNLSQGPVYHKCKYFTGHQTIF